MIIDFNNIYARAYYVQPDGAVYSFINILLNLLEKWNPSELFIAVDSHPTFRHSIFPDYKTHRPDKPIDYEPQMDRVLDILQQAGIKVLKVDGYEADDIIYTICRRTTKMWKIVTNDKDLLQLCYRNNLVLRPVKNVKNAEIWDGKLFYDKFGFVAALFRDYLALVGDSSDNIPGVKGIGPKNATKLMQWGTLDTIYENLEKVDPRRIRKLLINNKDEVFLYRKLVTLVDVPELIVDYGDYDIKRLHEVLK